MEKAILVAHKEDDSVNEALELCVSRIQGCACVAAFVTIYLDTSCLALI